jgi:small GTP-binding protein
MPARPPISTAPNSTTVTGNGAYTGPVQDRKLVIVGDGGCGKTSLLMVYTRKEFPEEYVPTVFDNYTKEVQLDKRMVNLALWDTAGQEDYDRLRPLSYPDTNVVVLCYAIDEPASLKSIGDKWAPEVSHFCGPNVAKILVGLKIDLRTMPAEEEGDEERPALVTEEQGQDMARRIGAYRYIECSAKYGQNVDTVFNEAVRGIWEGEKRRGSTESTAKKRKPFKNTRCTIL